jgi:hypothetical protein
MAIRFRPTSTSISTARLDEAIAKGITLYFVVDFELTRSRWYWLDEAGGQPQSDIPAFIPRPHPAVPAVERRPAPELSLARRRAAHPVATAQLAGARKGIASGPIRPYFAAVRMRLDLSTDAQDLPGERTGQPGLEPFLRVGALELHAHRDRRAWTEPRWRRPPCRAR